MYITSMEDMTMATEIVNTEYAVSRTENAWVVNVREYDADNVSPRVTVISVHRTRHEAISAARVLAGDSMYYVNDAPPEAISATDKQMFWGN